MGRDSFEQACIEQDKRNSNARRIAQPPRGDRITTTVAARGRWREILLALGIPEKVLNKRNQPCPSCGGKDRFRWVDYDETGGYICSQCGNGSGVDLLMKVRGWTFAQACTQIDHLLGHNSYISMHPKNRPAIRELCKSTKDAALWLRRYKPERLQAWLDRHDPEVRKWLEEV